MTFFFWVSLLYMLGSLANWILTLASNGKPISDYDQKQLGKVLNHLGKIQAGCLTRGVQATPDSEMGK